MDLRSAVGAADSELLAFARGVYPPAHLSWAGCGGRRARIEQWPGRGRCAACARMPAAIEVAAYFVCAEALANAVKHAGATRIAISGDLSAGVLRLTVTDDGVGGADPAGSGIQGLGDRMAAIGGVLEVSETQGGGTMVSAIVPIANAPNEVSAALSPPA